MSRLLVVEDDAGLAAGLRQGLAEQDFDVVVTPTLRAARAALVQGGIDLVLLDLGLPDGDGLELLGELRAAAGAPVVLVTSARGELEERLRGLEGGAEDYLVKPYAFAELVARVRILLRRIQPAAPARVELGDLSLDLVARRAWRGGELLDLTPREFDLLVRLALARGEVVSRETLAREVWRLRAWTQSMDNVIDVHMSRLRDKVDREATTRLVHTVRGAPRLLEQAVANLLDNALRHAPAGGRVRIKVATDAAGQVLLSVADSGPGLPPAAAPSAAGAEPAPVGRTGAEGAGLGLLIVSNVVRAHRGTMQVSPNDPHGATFTLRFPAAG